MGREGRRKERLNSVIIGTFLVIQWLRLQTPNRGPGFDPWSGNEIPHAASKSLNE